VAIEEEPGGAIVFIEKNSTPAPGAGGLPTLNPDRPQTSPHAPRTSFRPVRWLKKPRSRCAVSIAKYVQLVPNLQHHPFWTSRCFFLGGSPEVRLQ
jgi:hypothetical protein